MTAPARRSSSAPMPCGVSVRHLFHCDLPFGHKDAHRNFRLEELSKSALGPCEFPKCCDPKCERPEVPIHCDHDKSEHLWPHTVPPNEMHHLLIQSADTSTSEPAPLDPARLLEGITPGPWKVEDSRVFKTHFNVLPTVGRGIEICSTSEIINGGGGSPKLFRKAPEARANARLIAAAPDLARELGEALGVLRYIARKWDDPPTAKQLRERAQQFLEARTVAEGEK